MRTIESLRKDGYKVRVIQYRNYLRKSDREIISLSKRDFIGVDKAFIILPHGGKIHIDVTFPNGKTVSGESYCSLKDGFNRKVGNNIALGRALANEEI